MHKLVHSASRHGDCSSCKVKRWNDVLIHLKERDIVMDYKASVAANKRKAFTDLEETSLVH